jgi:hypothetical protein
MRLTAARPKSVNPSTTCLVAHFGGEHDGRANVDLPPELRPVRGAHFN